MKLTAVITNYNPDLPEFKKCFDAIVGQVDETIVVSSKGNSLSHKINKGLKMASGDYVLILNDDAIYESGNVENLCVPGNITCPGLNGRHAREQQFHAHAFCVPKYIYEETGGYDEEYEQAYYDDWDFWRNVEHKGFGKQIVDTVNFIHPPHGATTLGTLADINEIRERNRLRYYEKWGEDAKFGA